MFRKNRFLRNLCCLIIISIIFYIYFIPFYWQYEEMHETILNSINNNNEWSMMSLSKDLNSTNDAIFFRLNTAIYSHDQKLIQIYFICKEDMYFNKIKNKIFKFRFNAKINDNYMQLKEFYSSINDYKLHVFFQKLGMVGAQLKSHLSIENVNNIKEFKIFLSLVAVAKNREYFTKSQTNLINVKVKENTLTNSQQISICLEPSFNDEKTFLDFKWFAHLNLRHIGFDKIIFANNSISNIQSYNDLFRTFKNGIEIVPFNFLPNFFMPQLNKVYAREMRELSFTLEFTGAASFYQVYNEFSISECLLNNRDRNHLILFPSTDELFLPAKLKLFDYPNRTNNFVLRAKNLESKLKVNEFEKEYLSSDKCEKRESFKIKGYLESIYQKYSISKKSSLYFPQVFYLRDHLMEEIFAKLELSLTNFTQYPISVKIFQKHQKNIPKYDANFNIIISNQFEMNYANNLLNLYKYLIKPYLEKYKNEFAKHSERLSRIFYMTLKEDTDRDVRAFLGKSFVNPNTSEFMSDPHVPDFAHGYLYGTDRNHLYNLPPYHNKEMGEYYIAHFRDVHIMGQSSKLITRFHIDLNYFTCYVKNVIENDLKNSQLHSKVNDTSSKL
jgi:hypothetical protein